MLAENAEVTSTACLNFFHEPCPVIFGLPRPLASKLSLLAAFVSHSWVIASLSVSSPDRLDVGAWNDVKAAS